MELTLPKAGKNIYLKGGLDEVLHGEKIKAIPNRFGVFMFSPDVSYDTAIRSLQVILTDLELAREKETNNIEEQS